MWRPVIAIAISAPGSPSSTPPRCPHLLRDLIDRVELPPWEPRHGQPHHLPDLGVVGVVGDGVVPQKRTARYSSSR